MRNRILGTIGIVWGGLMVASFFLRGAKIESGSYDVGQIVGVIFGVLLCIAGFYYVFKKP